MVRPVLVRDQGSCATLRVSLERDLSIDRLEKEIAIALREDFESPLAGDLHEQMAAFTGDGDREFRRLLVLPDVTGEEFGIDGDLFV